jgi:hypothetical protein
VVKVLFAAIFGVSDEKFDGAILPQTARRVDESRRINAKNGTKFADFRRKHRAIRQVLTVA